MKFNFKKVLRKIYLESILYNKNNKKADVNEIEYAQYISFDF